MNSSSIELQINGVLQGENFTLSECYNLIEKAYSAFGDEEFYDGVVMWHLEQTIESADGFQLRIAHEEMAGALWEVYAEDLNAFRMWLDLFGWDSCHAD
jgi:hypothetical protein